MQAGRNIKLTAGRKVVIEILHHARQIPSLPLAATLDVSALIRARKSLPVSVSWTAIFMRAYGLLSQQRPELRRSYMRWPTAHFYEHPWSQAIALVEREWENELVILGGRFKSPETMTLAAIDERLSGMRNKPVWEVSCFRQLLRLGYLPGFIRRFAFWHSLYLLGSKRCKRFGTFTISSLGNMGVEQMHPLSPLTTYFTYGPISESGEVTAKIVYDHRVMDGRDGARCLNDLQQILDTQLLKDLRAMERVAA
jgi:hypothetical protein